MHKQDLYKNIVVIGGNVAGLAAASQAKRTNPDAAVTVLESGKYISYGSCGLPYYVSGQIKDFQNLFAYSPDFFEKQRNIKVLLNHKVTGLDIPGRKAIVNSNKKFDYDRLIICSGASPRPLDIPGSCFPNIFNLWNIEDTVRIKSFTEKQKPGKAIIVGGGSIGLLMAEAFNCLGIKVTIIELAASILPQYEPEISGIVHKKAALDGIDIILSANVSSFISSQGDMADRVAASRGLEKTEIGTDLILVCAGVRPNTEFIKSSSIELGTNQAIKVSRNLQSSIINIFAAGDCATIKNMVTGKEDYMPTANNAAKTGRIAGANAAGDNIAFRGSVKTKVDNFFGLEVASAGIGYSEAASLGYDCIKITGSYPSHIKAVGGAENITISLIADKKSRRVLGAQMAGRIGVAKRIDIFAAAITSEMTADEVYMLDLSYAPKVSTVWDPVNKISSKAVLELDQNKF